jgi:hypothetical protein
VLGVDHLVTIGRRARMCFRLHLVVDEEGLGHRAGSARPVVSIRMYRTCPALHQVAEDADQVAPDGAADAPVVHLEDLFLGVDDQVLVDADLAELVLDDGDPLAVLLGQDVGSAGWSCRNRGSRSDGHGYPVGHVRVLFELA